MDIWQLIERDHANIAQLIREIPYALNGPGVIRSRERLLADLIDELDLHGASVEASLYAPLSRQDRTRHLIAELRDEHRQFMSQLAGLERYRRKGSAGWLNTFEDVTFLVDQHLHRHVHELMPTARDLLGPEEGQNAARVYVRTKMRALEAKRRRQRSWLSSGDFTLPVALCAGAAGLGLIAWRTGVLRRLYTRHSEPQRQIGPDRLATGATPVPIALRPSSINKDPQRRGETPYAAMLRQALADIEDAQDKPQESDFTAEETIYSVSTQPEVFRGLVLPVLEEANVGFSQYGYQVYLEDRTLTEGREQRAEHPSVSFRIAHSTLPVDLVARQAFQFIFNSSAGKDEVRFRVLQPGSSVQDAAGQARDGGELTEEKLHELLAKALRLSLAQPI
jgi:hypothetical protein